MSLNQPLAKPLSLPLAKPLTGLGQDYFDAVAALGECWPLDSTLQGSEGTPITLTRASAAIYEDVLGKYQKFATNTPALSGGWLDVSGQIQNKCTNYNLNPADLTNVTTSGSGSFSAADKSTFLSTTKFSNLLSNSDINGKMIQCDNTGAGGTSTISFNGAAGNTNTHSIKVFVYVESGTATVKRSTTTAGKVALTASSALQEVVIEGFTAAAGDVIEVVVADDAIVSAFANMLTETSTAPKSLIECAGAAGTQALDDVQVSTTGWPVNDCAYYIELPKGIVDNGVNQYLFDSTVDASNWFRILFISGANLIRLSLRNTAVTVNLDVSYTADGTPIDLLLTADSTSGKSVYCSNGEIDTDASTVNLVFDTTCQIAAFNNLTLNLFAPVKMLKRFNSSDITLEGAEYAC